mgnify:CR=1 FL=1
MARRRRPIGPAVFSDDCRFTFAKTPEDVDAQILPLLKEKLCVHIRDAIESRTAEWVPEAKEYRYLGRAYRVVMGGYDEIVELILIGSEVVTDDDGNTDWRYLLTEDAQQLYGSW